MDNKTQLNIFDQDFCDRLEHQISFTLQFAADEIESEYWCDGVYPPEADEDNTPDHIRSNREIVTTAIIPRGQYEEEDYEYRLTIRLGDQSFERYLSGQRLDDCIPGTGSRRWVTVDHSSRTIEVALL